MSDEAIRAVYWRDYEIICRDGYPDHYYACVVVSDLGSEPFDRVWDLCLGEGS